MGTFKTIEAARDYFEGDRFAITNGMTIDELCEDRAVCSMDVKENHMNANRGVMGGVIFTLADFAFAVAANQIHNVTVSQQVSINYLSGMKGTRLIAEAKCKKTGRTTTVINVDVTDDTGREIAQYTGMGYKIL